MTTRPTTAQVEGFQIAAPPKLAAAPEPKWADLEPLPGGGDGVPILISNNPEIFTSTGLLAGSVQPKLGGTRGTTQPIPPLTDFAYYLFHINRTGGTKRVFLLASPAVDGPVSATVNGALNANAWAPGASTSVHTAKSMLTRYPIARTIDVLPGKAAALGYIDVWNGHSVDGRFAIRATGGLHVWDVAAPYGASTAEAFALAQSRFAPGEIKSPNAATGAMGRCAGLYRHERWGGATPIEVAETPFVRGFRFDERAQAFPGVATYTDSDPNSSGNYGSIYELEFVVSNATSRDARVSLEFASYPAQIAPNDLKEYWAFLAKRGWAIPTRLWDGHATVALGGKERLVPIFTKPTSPNAMRASLASLVLAPSASETIRVRIPVPGLISIPGALLVRAAAANAGALAEKETWSSKTRTIAAAPPKPTASMSDTPSGLGTVRDQPTKKGQAPASLADPSAAAASPNPAAAAPAPAPPLPRSGFNPDESWTIAFLKERRRQRGG
ncbi:MAG: hypothetical protein FJ096_14180 [Deltaproteobacteria bacterium]|nr:hypothetical protein [Deltaproteobacteria bacterium]